MPSSHYTGAVTNRHRRMMGPGGCELTVIDVCTAAKRTIVPDISVLLDKSLRVFL